MNQDNTFFNYEGDNWFLRNKDKLTEKRRVSKKDPVLMMLKEYGITPRRILEIGCSNGWRLDNLQKKYDARCVGIDPSLKALQNGRGRYPKLELHRGVASDLPLKECFDVVIVSFVFHWIAREKLLSSVAEIDRVVEEGGFLLISDFAPDVATRVPYHHLPKEKIYTYKMNYQDIFISTALYSKVASFTFEHEHDSLKAKVDASNRGACTLLRKSLNGFVSG